MGAVAVAAAAASTLSASAPANATAGTSFNVTVTAKDAYGNTATGYTGTVHFTSSDGQAVLPANYTFVAGDAGVHTFSVTLKTAGSQTVTATDTVTGSITGTSGIGGRGCRRGQHVVGQCTDQCHGGHSFNVTVTAKDAYGNTATGYTGTVHFTSSDGQAVLPANYTFVSGDAGVHTFSVTLKTAGNQTVTATDTVTGSITGSSGTVAVAAAAASTLSAQCTGQCDGRAQLQRHGHGQRAYGNTATGYTGTVHFTSSDAAGRAARPTTRSSRATPGSTRSA